MPNKGVNPLNPLTGRPKLGRPRANVPQEVLDALPSRPQLSRQGRIRRGELTPRQKQFCIEYLKDFDIGQAYLRAGFISNWPTQQGSKLLAKSKIKEQIERLKYHASLKWDLQPTKIVEKLIECYEGASTCGQWGSAARSLELLGKFLGMFNDKQTTTIQIANFTGKDDNSSVEDDLAKLRNLIDEVGLIKNVNDRVQIESNTDNKADTK